MNFRPGLKLWSTNTDLLPEAALLVQNGPFEYIELMPVPGTSVEPFVQYDIPFVLHCATERFGVNIADTTITEYNLQIIDKCLEWADVLGTEYVILHPGFGEIENSLIFLEKIVDPRVLIENMPKVGINGEKSIGYNLKQIHSLLNVNDFGLCLDLNHVVKGAISLKEDYKEYIKKIMSLNPVMFHIADGMLNIEIDEHLSIGDGEYDIEFMLECVDGFPVTIETPKKHNNLKNDLINVTKLINLIGDS